jgi:hypothetical protein
MSGRCVLNDEVRALGRAGETQVTLIFRALEACGEACLRIISSVQ